MAKKPKRGKRKPFPINRPPNQQPGRKPRPNLLR